VAFLGVAGFFGDDPGGFGLDRGTFGRPIVLTACRLAVANAATTSGINGMIWSTTSRGGRTRMIAGSKFLRFCWSPEVGVASHEDGRRA
jgi:hypothetical protein